MGNEVQTRLLALAKKAGLESEEGSVQRAELCACAQAVSRIFEMLEAGLDELFPDTMGSIGLGRYCELLNIGRSGTQQELMDEIISRLGRGFFQIRESEFNEQVKNTPGYNLVYTLIGLQMEIYPITYEVLSALSDLIQNYYPACYRPIFRGPGITFDDFDALQLRWYQIDELHIPFWIIDKFGPKLAE